MKRLTPALGGRLDNEDAERARRNHEQRIDELQKLPAAGMITIQDVELANDVETPIPHGLGRRPQAVIPSPVRGALATGRIEEIRDGSVDRSKFVILKATGFAADVTVDLVVL